jgi:predicted Zn finger-like uncharacterized protein
MLLTRCPDCDTTFRVTEDTLRKANGQVRCGRCASVFNAYAELHDPAAKSFEAEPAPTPPPAAPRPQATVTPRPSAPAERATSTERAAPPPVASPAPAEPTATPHEAAEPIGTDFVADVVAELKASSLEADAGGGDSEPDATRTDAELISANEVEQVLATAAPPSSSAEPWPALRSEAVREPASRWWGVAAMLALLALGAQAIHHFRSAVAGNATFGPWIQQAYAALGVQLTPAWDVRQYEILDWVATAEPSARGLGSLKITARIQNHGPLQQPYPAVKLRLKDRWEEAVSSRLFTPNEYLPADTPRGRLMSPGETARAQIEVVDPGPDAYGFELDICIEVEASSVTCGSDEVFL